MNKLTEDAIEQTALAWLESLAYDVKFGPDIAFEGTNPERDADANYTDVVLVGRLEEAVQRINPTLPSDAIAEAIRKVLRPESPSLIENNRAFQKMLTEGIDVSWMGKEGEQHGKVWLVDSVNPENNDWLAVNQFTVVEDTPLQGQQF